MSIEEILNQCCELKKQKGDFEYDLLDDPETAKNRFKKAMMSCFNDGMLTKNLAYRRLLQLREEMERF